MWFLLLFNIRFFIPISQAKLLHMVSRCQQHHGDGSLLNLCGVGVSVTKVKQELKDTTPERNPAQCKRE